MHHPSALGRLGLRRQCRDGEKWVILRSYVEAELLTRTADGLDVGGVGKEGNQDGSYVCSLGNCWEVVPFTEMGKWGLGQVTWKGGNQLSPRLSDGPQLGTDPN